MKYIIQHDSRDCGATCLCMIARYYGMKISIAKCRELTATDRSGTNIYGLVDGAAQIGLSGNGLSGDQAELEAYLSDNKSVFPFIAHIISERNQFHFVVVEKITRNCFVIADPEVGKRRISKEDFYKCWTGNVIFFSKTDEFDKNRFKQKTGIVSILPIVLSQYKQFISIIVLSLIVSLIGILGTFVFKIIIDSNFDGLEIVAGTLGLNIYNNGIGIIGLIFGSLIILYVFQGLFNYIRGWLLCRVSAVIEKELSLSYYDHLVDLPVSSIQTRQVGEYLSRFGDIESIRQAVSSATVTLFFDSFMAIIGGIILAKMNLFLFQITLIIVLLYIIIVTIYRKPIENKYIRVMEDNAILQSWLKESIDGLEMVKAHNAVDETKKDTKERSVRLIKSLVSSSLLSLSQETVISLVDSIGGIILLWIGFNKVLTSEMTLGSLMTFYALFAYFSGPIKSLLELQPLIQKAAVANDRLSDVMGLTLEEVGIEDERLKIDKLELNNINFRYGQRELTLEDISLNIHKGEKIAIIGESGSGKTTLVKLLLKFYNPESGQILINGKNISDISIKSIRDAIAYVDQDSFLFADTIKNNLKFGNEDITDEEIVNVCKLCKADEFISKLPMKYDFPLCEKGTNLSVGQRQRLAIARALLRKPDVLILDEATSNLDTITESAIKDVLFSYAGDIIYIIIAHRMSTISNCDRIVVMDGGKIIEDGTHDELMSKKGKYFELKNKQL